MPKRKVEKQDSERGFRTRCVTSRFSPAELDRLEEWRGDVPRGEYVRRAILATPPRPVPRPNAEAYRELARTAANLNQLARRLNESGAAEVEEVRRELKAFRLQLLGVEWTA